MKNGGYISSSTDIAAVAGVDELRSDGDQRSFIAGRAAFIYNPTTSSRIPKSPNGRSGMVRLGGTASVSHMEVFQGLEKLFRRKGIDLDWVLYSGYDEMVDAFVKGEIDLAWNGPLSYVKIKRLAEDGVRVIAMRDVDINFTTHFITRADSGIETVEDLKDRTFAFGRRSSVQSGLLRRDHDRRVGRSSSEGGTDEEPA